MVPEWMGYFYFHFLHIMDGLFTPWPKLFVCLTFPAKFFTLELPASGCSPKTPIEISRVTRVANAVRRASRRASRRERRMLPSF